MSVRLYADWMVLADERILEVLEDTGPGSPTDIVNDDRIRFSRQHINNRCRLLEDSGLARNVSRGVYVISNAGADYLAGELDASELPDPTE